MILIISFLKNIFYIVIRYFILKNSLYIWSNLKFYNKKIPKTWIKKRKLKIIYAYQKTKQNIMERWPRFFLLKNCESSFRKKRVKERKRRTPRGDNRLRA